MFLLLYSIETKMSVDSSKETVDLIHVGVNNLQQVSFVNAKL